MKLYEEYFVPHLINCVCGLKSVEEQRAKIIPQASGKVLEIGMGSGLNLKYYDPTKVEMVWGLEPSEGMRRKAQKNIAESKVPVEWLGLPSEKIPLEDDSVDTVILTFTLCSISGWTDALAEMKRVLKSEGRLLFCEHGEAPDESTRKWQNRINPIWKRVMGGCNIDRRIPEMLESANFSIKQIDQGYIDGPKLAAYQYWGLAQKS